MNTVVSRPVGVLLREWRQRRNLSQLALATDVEMSTRHLSFVETGRSLPSRELLIRLARRLDVPLRERNALMLAAGYAPIYPQRPLNDDGMRVAREAVEMLLSGHEPYPALAIDRHWTLVSANRAARRLLAGVSAALLEPPVNVLRVSLHPNGLAPLICNLRQWRDHVFERLAEQVASTADPTLAALLDELRGYPGSPAGADRNPTGPSPASAVVVPLQLATDAGVLSLIGTTTVFGTPVDVTLSELAIESFFPADAATAALLQRLGASEG